MAKRDEENRKANKDLADYYAAMAKNAKSGAGREHAQGVSDYYTARAKKGGK